jgi:hypothetical protein
MQKLTIQIFKSKYKKNRISIKIIKKIIFLLEKKIV